MKHEQDTLEKVIQARNQALSARTVGEKSLADGQVTQALGGMLAISESYPELRSNENMMSLQEELKSTENKIAFARQYYNDVVTVYNTRIETFPSSLFASSGNFKEKELFEIEVPAQRENVTVRF
jgi:LemA protein